MWGCVLCLSVVLSQGNTCYYSDAFQWVRTRLSLWFSQAELPFTGSCLKPWSVYFRGFKALCFLPACFFKFGILAGMSKLEMVCGELPTLDKTTIHGSSGSAIFCTSFPRSRFS